MNSMAIRTQNNADHSSQFQALSFSLSLTYGLHKPLVSQSRPCYAVDGHKSLVGLRKIER